MFNYEVKYRDNIYGADCTARGYVQADCKENAFKTVIGFYDNCYSVNITNPPYDVIEIRHGELIEWTI